MFQLSTLQGLENDIITELNKLRLEVKNFVEGSFSSLEARVSALEGNTSVVDSTSNTTNDAIS